MAYVTCSGDLGLGLELSSAYRSGYAVLATHARADNPHLLGQGARHDPAACYPVKDAAAPSVQRWWHQRLSAVALLPLSLWFMYDMVTTLVSPEYTAVRAWLATPSTMLLFILLTPALFYHAFIGIHEVIEDYITNERCKTRGQRAGARQRRAGRIRIYSGDYRHQYGPVRLWARPII